MQNNSQNPTPTQDLQDLYNVKRPNPTSTNEFNPNADFTPAENISQNLDTTQTSYYQNDLGAQGIYANDEQEVPIYTTPSEPKKNNRLFYIVTGIISLILLLIIGILGYLIYNSSLNNDSSSSAALSSSSSSQSVLFSKDDSSESSQEQLTFTDPSGISPAEASKVNNETALSTEFLTTYFNPEAIIDGNCNDLSICGPNVDFDEDGMENILEFNYQTDPTLDDTDRDGISDGDEFIYGTNPKEVDSDGDKIDDLNEIVACSNPALKTFTPVKMFNSNIENITDSALIRGLQTTTIDSLVEAGASSDDLKVGLILSNCSTTSIVFTE